MELRQNPIIKTPVANNVAGVARSPRWWMVVAALAAGCVILGLIMMSWQEGVDTARAEREHVEKLIAQGRGEEALIFIQVRNRTVKKQSERLRRVWLALEAAALAQTGDGPRLLTIYHRVPAAIENQEPASLQVCRALLRVGDFERFDKLREAWRKRETSPAPWFEVDVDALLLRGKRNEAIQQLQSRSFPGAADSGRLMRLAMVRLSEDPGTAAKYLEQAVSLDPRNPEVRLQRGRMFERAGSLSAANAEYNAAFGANTNNAYFRDQLAEFLRRTGNYDLAAYVWAGGLVHITATDSMWVRALFWTRVARTIQFDWTAVEPPPGLFEPFVRYLKLLPPGTFWEEAAFNRLPPRRYEEVFQETFWLRLLATLQAGREEDALKLLVSNRFRPSSYNLELESALLRVLNFRKSGEVKFPPDVNLPLSKSPPRTRHQLFELLDALTKEPGQPMPENTALLLRSPDAFAAVFLAAGWAEAALQLARQEVIPDGFPTWVAFGLTQARRFNRGNANALEFAARQAPTPMLDLFTADMLIADGRIAEAMNKLTPLAAKDSEEGMYAARAIAETQLRLKHPDEARAAVTAQPRLEHSTAGQELLARIALQQGDAAAADKLYAGIETTSDEAREYLARKAIADQDWPRARRLTEELLKKYPDQTGLRASLEEIKRAEAAK